MRVEEDRWMFLDLDGVVNHHDYLRQEAEKPFDKETWKERQFNPMALMLVNRLIISLRCKVIFSTSWRKTKDLNQILQKRGFLFEAVGITPHIEGPRGHEIQAWMDENGVKDHQIIILDDDNDMDHLSHRLVRTSNFTGIMEKHLIDAYKLFGLQYCSTHACTLSEGSHPELGDYFCESCQSDAESNMDSLMYGDAMYGDE